MTAEQGTPSIWQYGLPPDTDPLWQGYYWLDYERGGLIGLFHVVWPLAFDFAGNSKDIHDMGVVRWAGSILQPIG